MDSLISTTILPLLGIGIIIFCILSFFFPYGGKFKDKTQRFKGLGVDMEVSVLTLFIIVGFVMSFTGIYFRIRDYENKLASAKADALAAKKALLQGRKMQINALITLEGTSGNDMPRLEEVECKYFLYGIEQPVEVQVSTGLTDKQFRIVLKDITPDTVIRRLVLKDRSTQRKWILNNFAPFEPFYNLKREE